MQSQLTPSACHSDTTKSMSTHLIPRVLLRFVNGKQSHNNDVLMAIMVREFPHYFEGGL